MSLGSATRAAVSATTNNTSWRRSVAALACAAATRTASAMPAREIVSVQLSVLVAWETKARSSHALTECHAAPRSSPDLTVENGSRRGMPAISPARPKLPGKLT